MCWPPLILDIAPDLRRVALVSGSVAAPIPAPVAKRCHELRLISGVFVGPFVGDDLPVVVLEAAAV